MASKTKRTEAIRKRKDKPNKANMQEEQKRIQKNHEVLARVVEEK
jgi:hypothetical protein